MIPANDLPPVPDGKVRVIDDCELDHVTLTEDGCMEVVAEVHEWHLEDEDSGFW